MRLIEKWEKTGFLKGLKGRCRYRTALRLEYLTRNLLEFRKYAHMGRVLIPLQRQVTRQLFIKNERLYVDKFPYMKMKDFMNSYDKFCAPESDFSFPSEIVEIEWMTTIADEIRSCK